MRLAVTFLSVQILFITSCSMLGPVYVKTGYRTDSINTIRSARLIIRKPPEKPELAPLISAIASDTIRVKTGYKITTKDFPRRLKEDKCREDEGSLIFSVEELKTVQRNVIIYIRGKLIRCSNSEVIWRAEGRYDGKPGDERLKNLVRYYRREYGEIAELYTEPVYFLMRDIIHTLPDPKPVKN
jgi:probable lipoprotein (TIGR04455 family)